MTIEDPPIMAGDRRLDVLETEHNQLKTSFDEFRAHVDERFEDVVRRQDHGFTNLRSVIDSHAKSQMESKRFNTSTAVALIGACGMAIWTIINLQMNNLISTAESKASERYQTISGEISYIKQQNATSVDDRAHTAVTLSNILTDLALIKSSLSSEIATRQAKETEIETQFHASDELHNVQFAEQQRMNAIIWNATKTLGTYPAGPFYQPHVATH